MLRSIVRLLVLALLSIPLLAACGQARTAAPTAFPAAATAAATPGAATGDLAGIKAYLLTKVAALTTSTAALKQESDHYYELAKAASFDYAALWKNQRDPVIATVEQARSAWKAASPGYEQIEGIVAGVPSLAEYDVILDAGAAGSEGGDNVVPFDLTLPDGRVLPKPGNLFGVTESALWGTFPEYTVASVAADFDGDGKQGFGEALPDANVLKGGADALDRYAGELAAKAQAWQPTESDAFTALVVMVPTMNEYFDSWKNSPFVAGDAATQRDFVAISRLADIQDILSGLQVVYGEVSPRVASVDAAQDRQAAERLSSLKAFVADVYAKEQAGKRFSPEEADLLGAEAQNRATAIAGQLTQLAAQLKVPIQQ
jgi:hypothetical protein